ncbi:uncharacterized protein PRCAT00003486001 [Priceomyces carsonii]|uniref:uncharacterized protein n=1 Tax=Priceomyces carsonii TaxID=28549 RepID=UPI002ED9F142|nr:unnamed protein product [Priceomyces carsonii]
MSIACDPCRRRKCKCDSVKPACTQCRLRKVICTYNKVGDKRRRSQSHFDLMSSHISRLQHVINLISEGGVRADLTIKKLQNDKRYSESLLYGDKAIGSTDIEFEGDLLKVDNQGKIHFYGETSNIPKIIQNDTIISQKLSLSSNSDIYTLDISHFVPDYIVSELLQLYFCWQHVYYNVFDMQLFLRDMKTGGMFYSDFLLNAILSHACHLSSRPELRSDPLDARTTGYFFHKKALKMLHRELENSSLTTVQGLLLLASKESGIGCNSIGWVHSGMAVRIAIDLGIHHDAAKLAELGYISEEEVKVRNTTFWGCYLFDQGWSSYLGRPPAIRMCDVSINLPDFHEEKPLEWVPFYESSNQFPDEVIKLEFYPENTLLATLKLYHILELIIFSLYTSRKEEDNVEKKKNYRLLLEEHYQLLELWRAKLPDYLRYSQFNTHPAILMLQGMYQSITIFLFRPYIKLSERNWRIENIPDPLDQCRQCAKSILEILRRYKKLYSLNKIVNLTTYLALTASTVYLTVASSTGSFDERDQNDCLSILSEIGTSWPEANAVHDVIKRKFKSILAPQNENDSSLLSRYAIGCEWIQELYLPLDEFMIEMEESTIWDKQNN